jgi:hypothetical protein
VEAQSTGGSRVSPLAEAAITQPVLNAPLALLAFIAAVQDAAGGGRVPTFGRQVNGDAAWLQAQVSCTKVVVNVDASGLGIGTYAATITISAVGVSGVMPMTGTVTLRVVQQIYPVHLPLVQR